MLIRMSERGQIVIPAPLRRKLGLAAGQRVELVEAEGALLLRPLQESPLAGARGRMRGAKLVETLLEDRRRDG